VNFKAPVVMLTLILVLSLFSFSMIIPVEADPTTKFFVLTADPHWGSVEGTGSDEECTLMVDWIKYKNPDFMLMAGDVAEGQTWGGGKSTELQLSWASENFSDIISNTNIEKIWWTFGGNHDGYVDANYNNWDGATFLRSENLSSLWYTIKVGNNVFIFCSIIGCDATWSDSDWSIGNRDHIITQPHIDWLESQLAKYDTNNNIFIICHTQVQNTNIASGDDDWAQMGTTAWETVSTQLRNMFGNYSVDAWIHGHVHADPSHSYDDDNECNQGNIVLQGFNGVTGVMNTTYCHIGSVFHEHGAIPSIRTFPSLYYFNLTEGNSYIDIVAHRLDTNESVGITYNDSAGTQSSIRIPLDHSISGLSGNSPDDFEQFWCPWRYSDEAAPYQWWKDSQGFRIGKAGWVEHRYDLWEEKNITGFWANWSNTAGITLTHKIYRCTGWSGGNPSWSSGWWDESNVSGIPDSRWLFVNTSFTKTGSTGYIYNMSFNTTAGGGSLPFAFTSIDGGVNNSQTISSNRTFIWALNSSASYYHLQVSNTSDFASPFIDINDISESNYAQLYSENATHVTFTLPELLETYGAEYGFHYYRVRYYEN